MRRGAFLLVGAGIVVAACGRPAPVRTIASGTAGELGRLLPACAAIDATVRTQLTGTGGGVDAYPPRLSVADGQCRWTRIGSPAPQLVAGVVQDGDTDLAQTAKFLPRARPVDGVGDDALFDPQSRALFAVQGGRLWYVELVGAWPSNFSPPAITTAVGRALLRAAATT